MSIRLATYLGDQGIAIHNCEMKEWQEKTRSLKSAVVSFSSETLALAGLPHPPHPPEFCSPSLTFSEAADRFHQAIANQLVPSAKEKP